MHVKDQIQRKIELSIAPKRIISLVPSQTELLVDLGLKSSLVGITKFCVHPKNLRRDVTVVGGTKQVHFEKIAALNPDLIICNKEENTQEMVVTLEKIASVWVSDIVTVDDSLKMIAQLGELLGVSEKASELIATISSEQRAFAEFMTTIRPKKVAYIIWKNPYMATGSDTFIDGLLQLNKFQNIISEKRYPEVSVAQLGEADLILLSSEPYPFKQRDIQKLKEKINTEVRLVDGEYFSWYGSRLQNAFSYFRTLH